MDKSTIGVSFSSILSPLAAILILVSSIPNDLNAADGKWLNIALPGKPATLIPWDMDDALACAVIQNNMSENLVRYGRQSLTLEPNLAVSWEVQQAGRVWLFTLRENVLFHDGSTLTADDVAESIGKNPYFEGTVEKESRLRVRFVFPDKKAGFLKTLSKVNFSIAKVDSDGNILGTGPFLLEKWDDSDKIVLRSFQNYWGEKSPLEGVTFHCSMEPEESIKLMRTGGIDVMYMVPPRLAYEIESDKSIVLSRLKGASISFIHINPRRPPLDEPVFRRALNMVINRDNIIKSVYFGQAIECKGVLPPVIGGKEEGPSKVTFNPKEAKKVIGKYLAGKNRVFKMIGLPFPRPYCPDPSSMARLVAGYLKGAGLKIEYVHTNSWTEWLDRVSGDDYDFIITGWVLDSRNPDDLYTDIFGAGDVDILFGSSWENESFESLILKAKTTVSVKQRWELYHQAENIFFEEFPWIILAHPNRLGAYRKEITGLDFSPTCELRLGLVKKGS